MFPAWSLSCDNVTLCSLVDLLILFALGVHLKPGASHPKAKGYLLCLDESLKTKNRAVSSS